MPIELVIKGKPNVGNFVARNMGDQLRLVHARRFEQFLEDYSLISNNTNPHGCGT
jgi:hypothetical protein